MDEKFDAPPTLSGVHTNSVVATERPAVQSIKVLARNRLWPGRVASAEALAIADAVMEIVETIKTDMDCRFCMLEHDYPFSRNPSKNGQASFASCSFLCYSTLGGLRSYQHDWSRLWSDGQVGGWRGTGQMSVRSSMDLTRL